MSVEIVMGIAVPLNALVLWLLILQADALRLVINRRDLVVLWTLAAISALAGATLVFASTTGIRLHPYTRLATVGVWMTSFGAAFWLLSRREKERRSAEGRLSSDPFYDRLLATDQLTEKLAISLTRHYVAICGLRMPSQWWRRSLQVTLAHYASVARALQELGTPPPGEEALAAAAASLGGALQDATEQLKAAVNKGDDAAVRAALRRFRALNAEAEPVNGHIKRLLGTAGAPAWRGMTSGATLRA